MAFQALIGILRTPLVIGGLNGRLRFQALIGILRTWSSWKAMWNNLNVSSPYRYSANVSDVHLGPVFDGVSSPYRYSANLGQRSIRPAFCGSFKPL